MVVRALRAVLALVVLSLGLVLAAGTPAAAACDCKRSGVLERQVEQADVVFLATVDAVTDESPGHSYALTAARAYQGSVEHSTAAQSLAGVGDCGLGDLEVGRDYLFMATGTTAPYAADSCGGTARANPDRVARVEAILGEGQVVSPPPPPEATMEKVEESPPLGFARLAAPGAAAVLLGALGLVVVRRLARR